MSMGLDWPNTVYPCFTLWGVHCVPDIVSFLQVQPKISGIPEDLCQNQSRIDRDCPLVVAQLINRLPAYHHRFCKAILGNP